MQFKTEKCIKTTSDNSYVDTVVVKWDTKEIVTKYKQRNVNLQDIAVNGSVTTDRVRWKRTPVTPYCRNIHYKSITLPGVKFLTLKTLYSRTPSKGVETSELLNNFHK